MNFELESSEGKIPRKRERNADAILHADGISSFEARRINVRVVFCSSFTVAAFLITRRCFLDSSM
jgi:hypothetical protein